MSWTFRLRIHLHESARLNIDSTEYSILGGAALDTLSVAAWPEKAPLRGVGWLLLKGTACSEEAAWERGSLLLDVLRRAFARLRIAADHGKEPTGGLTSAGREFFASDTDRPVLDDVHGLMVYPTDPAPRFLSGGAATLSMGHAEWRFEQTLQAAIRDGVRMTERERIAFDLFSASRFENSSSARLFMLVMAIETLLVPKPRSPAASAHVEQLIAATRDANAITPDERHSILGSLAWLRQESITSSGRKLVKEHLGERLYDGKTADTVWKTSYNARSTLTHGGHIGQTEIEKLAALMFEVVGDLLSGGIIAFQPHQISDAAP